MNYSLPMIFALFLLTLHPSITAGDSAEITAAAFSQGIPHPPGYPLYVIAAKFFTVILPFGSMAYRVNLLSAVFGALSCWMAFQIAARVGKSSSYSDRLAGIIAATSLAFSYEFWYRSTVAEVYSLNVFMVLLIIYVLLVWREGGKRLQTGVRDGRLLYLVAFLLGLGLGNHHTIVLVIPGALIFILWTLLTEVGHGKKGVESHVIIASLSMLFFVLGSSIYLYLPVRSIKDPFMDWGNPQSLGNFIDVFTRKAYLPESVERTWVRLIEQLRTFNPIYEFTPIGFSAGLIGIWFLWSTDRKTWAMLSLTFVLAGYGLIFLAGGGGGDMSLLKKFYLPSYAAFSIFMGIGVKQGIEWTESALLRRFIYALCLISVIWQFASHYPRTQNSENYLAFDYGMNELNSLPEGSVYISKGEVKTFPLWYLQGVEKYREDAKVITAYFLTQAWYLPEVFRQIGIPREIPSDLTYRQLLIDTIYKRYADRGVFTGFFDKEYLSGDLLTSSQGITFRLYRTGEEKSRLDVWPKYRDRGIVNVEEEMDRGIIEILKDYSSSHYNEGLEQFEAGDPDRAIIAFEKAVAINPKDPDSLHNLAVLYAEKGIKLKEAEKLANKAFEIYTGEQDREMARKTLEEILKK